MKLHAPQLTGLREAGMMKSKLIELQQQEKNAEGLQFSSEIISEEKLSGIDYHQVEFINCSFYGCDFSKSGFINVRFRHCDLSNCAFENGYFSQVEFISCKGLGSKFPNVSMKQVLISDSNFTYANFGQSKLQKMIISSSDFSNACLAESKLKDIELENVVLNRCDFFKTPLRGIDFRKSRIDGIMLSDSYQELAGSVVDTYQAAALALLLGIEVK